MFKKIKRFYEMGLWSETQVKDAVGKGIISANEYKEITGSEY